MNIKNRPTTSASDLSARSEEISWEKGAQSHQDLESLSPEETPQTLLELRARQIKLEMR